MYLVRLALFLQKHTDQQLVVRRKSVCFVFCMNLKKPIVPQFFQPVKYQLQHRATDGCGDSD